MAGNNRKVNKYESQKIILNFFSGRMSIFADSKDRQGMVAKAGRSFLIGMMLLFSLSVWAQQNGVDVTGGVVDEQNQTPIEQATVRLLQIKDSALVRGVASSRTGGFTLKNVKAGNYLLSVSFVGYDPLYQRLQITGKINPVHVGKLKLHDGGVHLGEAVVIGKAAEVVVRNDTLEYNADSYKIAEGSMLEDLLKKMPGVEVDKDGKVTVNGKEIKKIMVDGKEFFSDDPKVASKNLPSKMVDKVQVLDKKSDMAKMTGFDDGEEETVINLTVKPGMKQGWFGNAFAGYGSKERYEVNAMVNRFVNNDQITLLGGANNTNNMGFSDLASTMFGGGGGGRRGIGGAGSGIMSSGNGGLNFSKEFNSKMTLGGNARYSHSDNDARSKSSKENILPGDSSSFDNNQSVSHTKDDNIGADLRMEWQPDTMTRFILRPSFSYSQTRSSEFSEFNTIGGLRDTVNAGNSSYLSEGNGYNTSLNLDFSRKLNSKGRVFSASLSGSISDSDTKGSNFSDIAYFRNEDAKKNEIIDQQFRNDNTSYNYRVYVSWVEPIGHNNFLQATYSFSQRKQESLKKTYIPDEEGMYTILDTAYSQSYRNDFISQRASLSFKSQRTKFNYTVGINIDPSYSSSRNFVGDSTLSKISRSVTNLSPMAQFNYMFDKRTHLRIVYNGRTSQPSVSQLQPVADLSDPLNIRIGNPDLNPRYTNNLSIRFQRFVPEKQRAFMVMTDGSYILNDIVSYTTYNKETGGKTTTYKNVNGNYNANVRIMMNTPLKNKKFSVNSSTMASFANSNGYINEEKNTNQNINVSERFGIDFRSSYLDIGATGDVRYNGTHNSLQKQNNQNTWNYNVGGYTTLYLPWNFKIESDITWATNSGYGNGFKQNEILWNASASKSFLKNNQGTLRFKIYDLLHQRSNISRSVTANYIMDSEYNTLSSYFMFHFIYRFSIFKGGAGMKDAPRSERGRSQRQGQRPMGPPRRF